VVVPVDLRQ